MPLKLFWEASRTRVLALAAALGEIYVYESIDVLGLTPGHAKRTMDKLVREGVLRSRKFGAVRFYGLNPEFPGAKPLQTLLEQIASERPEVQAAARQALIRRAHLAVEYTAREKAMIANIAVKRRCPRGIRKSLVMKYFSPRQRQVAI